MSLLISVLFGPLFTSLPHKLKSCASKTGHKGALHIWVSAKKKWPQSVTWWSNKDYSEFEMFTMKSKILGRKNYCQGPPPRNPDYEGYNTRIWGHVICRAQLSFVIWESFILTHSQSASPYKWRTLQVFVRTQAVLVLQCDEVTLTAAGGRGGFLV